MTTRYREYPYPRTTIEHYPMRPGDVVVRWRGSDDPDGCGYIVEAHVGIIVEGSGHYGESLNEARKEAAKVRAFLATIPITESELEAAGQLNALTTPNGD